MAQMWCVVKFHSDCPGGIYCQVADHNLELQYNDDQLAVGAHVFLAYKPWNRNKTEHYPGTILFMSRSTKEIDAKLKALYQKEKNKRKAWQNEKDESWETCSSEEDENVDASVQQRRSRPIKMKRRCLTIKEREERAARVVLYTGSPAK